MKNTVWTLWLLSVALTPSASVFANSMLHPSKNGIKLCDFAPKNTKKIPIAKSLADATGITEAEFNKGIDLFVSTYAPIVKAHGANLVLNRLWSDPTVNSDTTVSGNDWIINAYGGLARYPHMTYDGYVAVLAHEMGHHLGGFPHYSDEVWASNEGESDYFATLKGFRTLFWNDDNSAAIAGRSIPKTVSDQCSVQHKDSKEIALCIRGALAGEVLGNVLNDLGGASSPVKFETPDVSQVAQTNDEHPQAQCRLDTYFYGAICGATHTEDLGTNNPTQGACAEEKGDHFGVRSHCWYKPQN